jgi:hypothetical protein
MAVWMSTGISGNFSENGHSHYKTQFEAASCAGWIDYLGKIDDELPTTSLIRGEN